MACANVFQFFLGVALCLGAAVNAQGLQCQDLVEAIGVPASESPREENIIFLNSENVCSIPCSSANGRASSITLCCTPRFQETEFSAYRFISCMGEAATTEATTATPSTQSTTSSPSSQSTTSSPSSQSTTVTPSTQSTTSTPSSQATSSTSTPGTPGSVLPRCPSGSSTRRSSFGNNGVCSVMCRQGRGSFAGIPFGPFTDVTRYLCCEGYERRRVYSRQQGRFITDCQPSSTQSTSSEPTATSSTPSSSSATTGTSNTPSGSSSTTSTPATSQPSTGTPGSVLPRCPSGSRTRRDRFGNNGVCSVMCRQGRGSVSGIPFGPFTDVTRYLCCEGYEGREIYSRQRGRFIIDCQPSST